MKILKLFPGIILSVLIAALSLFIEGLLPVHVIGAAVIAMFIGMALNPLSKKPTFFRQELNSHLKNCLSLQLFS